MSTPAPSQLRTIAPRLPGSVTPSTATRNGRARAVAPLAQERREVGLGDRGRLGEHALGRLAARLRLELLAGHVRDRDAVGGGDRLDVVDGVGALEIGADPDLVHAAALREQQLTHRLAALDLLAAEALRSGRLGRPPRRAGGSGPVRPAPAAGGADGRHRTPRRGCRPATAALTGSAPAAGHRNVGRLTTSPPRGRARRPPTPAMPS